MRGRVSRSRLGIWIVIAVVSLSSLMVVAGDSVSGSNPTDDRMLSPEGIFAMYATMYNERHDVGMDAAAQRVLIEGELQKLVGYLEDDMADVYTELRIEHDPEYRIVLRVTAAGLDRARAYLEDSSVAGLITYEVTQWTLVELREHSDLASKLLNSVGVNHARQIHGERVEIFVLDYDDAMSRLEAGDIVLPPTVDIRESPDIGSPDIGSVRRLPVTI